MVRKLMMLLLLLLCAVPAMAEGSLLEEYAVRLAQELPSIISNEAYVALYTGGFDEESGALIAQHRGYTWTQPTFDLHLTCDLTAWEQAAAEQGIVLTDEYEQYAQQFMPSMIYSMLNSTVDQAEVVAGGVMQNALYYADPAQADGTVMFIRFFGDGTPLLYHQSTREGAVLLNAQVLSADGLAECRCFADAQSWLETQTGGVVLGHEEPILLPYAGSCAGEGTMPLRVQALALDMMRDMADTSYNAMLIDSEQILALLADWADGDYSQPRLMACAELDPLVLGTSVWGMDMAGVFRDETSPTARNLRSRLAGSVTMRLSSVSGVNAIVAHSVSGHGAMYADPQQPDGIGLYILLYEDGNAIAVSYQAENGVVVLSASCLPDSDLKDCSSAADISLHMLKNQLPMTFSEIETEDKEMNE